MLASAKKPRPKAAAPGRSLRRWATPVIAALAALAAIPLSVAGDLTVIDSTEAPWPSIGRVNVGGYRSTSMCTGTLIAPRIVLTAAHCLFNKKSLKPFPVEDIHFIAGVRRDEFAERLDAACVLTAKAYVSRTGPKLRDVRNDVGILVLEDASSLPPVPVLSPADAGILNRDTRFRSVGYRRSRRFLPTLIPACRVLGTVGESWVTDCASESGASGGPLLVETPHGLRVAGVMSASIDDTRSAIVPFFAWQELLENPMCPAPETPAKPALRSSIADNGRPANTAAR
ncbi:trypsin-like serine protease [Roseibium sp.]|uniref:trypsin-like serine peptidase n=1 Tax=Roseibium sp. TaxID=1936156 RepID=UPI003265ABEE